MGDPLSIVASSIAILGALTTSGKGISKLISLRHAPEELQDLSNEVESLRLILEHIRLALLNIHGSQLYRDYEGAMTSLLQDMRRAVDDLESLIVCQLQRVDKDGTISLSKREWLQASSKIEKKKQRISKARSKLGTMMDAMNLQLGGQAERQHALQIQSISLVSQNVQSLQQDIHASLATISDNTQSALAMQGDRLASLLVELALSRQQHLTERGSQAGSHIKVEQSLDASHQEIGEAESPAESSPNASNAQPGESLSSAEPSESIDHTPASTAGEHPPRHAGSAISRAAHRDQSTASCVRVATTMSVRACPKFCKCQCHVHTHFQTPRILRDIVGQLFFSYTGQLRTSNCNYPPCRQSNVKRRFT